MKKTIIFLLGFTLLFVCNAAKAEVINLSEAENGKQIQATKGDVIRINLKGNATTGYSWQFQIDDAGITGKIAEGYIPNEVPAGMVGTGGTFEYILKVLKEGKVTITAYYFRSWEKLDKENDSKVEYIINVTSSKQP